MKFHVKLTYAVLLLGLGVARGQTLPDVGEQLSSSASTNKSGPRVQSGCTMRFDKANRRLSCAGGMSGVVASVDLDYGTQTVVSNPKVVDDSLVECGCEVASDGEGCNTGGQWLARKWVKSKGSGTYTIGHSFALGDETITCLVQ